MGPVHTAEAAAVSDRPRDRHASGAFAAPASTDENRQLKLLGGVLFSTSRTTSAKMACLSENDELGSLPSILLAVADAGSLLTAHEQHVFACVIVRRAAGCLKVYPKTFASEALGQR